MPRAQVCASNLGEASLRRITSCQKPMGLRAGPKPSLLLIRGRLTRNPVVHTSNVCQRKEEFQTRRKGVEGWFHGKPPRGGGRKKSLEKQLVPLKFYHVDQDRVTQWKNPEVLSWKSPGKLQCPTFHLMDESLDFWRKSLTPQFLFSFWKQLAKQLPEGIQLHYALVLLFSNSLCVNYAFHKKRCCASTRHDARPQEEKAPWNEGKGKAWRSVQDREVRVAASSSVPAGRNSSDALCPGRAPQTRPLMCGDFSTNRPVAHEAACLLRRALPNRAMALKLWSQDPCTFLKN